MVFGLDSAVSNRIKASREQIEKFCQRWNVTEFALFGSVLRDDYRPDSDIDVLLTFRSYEGLSLFGLMDIKDELKDMLGREVDVADKQGLKNPYRRHEILKTHRVIYSDETS